MFQIDFDSSHLSGSELQKAIHAYEDQWIDEVLALQRLTDKQYSEGHTCHMVKCLPKELRERYYKKYFNGQRVLREDIKRIKI